MRSICNLLLVLLLTLPLVSPAIPQEYDMRILSDDNLAAMNAWIEARGESFEGLVAVCEVMRNRMRQVKWDKDGDKSASVAEVVLAPYQFSGWNTKDPNRLKALVLDDQDPGFQRALRAWQYSATSNLVKGATMYYNPKVITTPPAWAKPELRLATVGSHEFFRE
jgi:N-acetylmuramoyl-L-alanine amidase